MPDSSHRRRVRLHFVDRVVEFDPLNRVEEIPGAMLRAFAAVLK